MKQFNRIEGFFIKISNAGMLVIFTFLLLTANNAYAQNKIKSGYPLINNYSPKEYGAFQSNWAIAQDKRGVMYFGNDSGLLEFDGESWRLYQVTNKTTVRSISIADDGKLYVGAVAELGYFMSDDLGRLTYHSLIKYIPKNNLDFADVWGTFIYGDNVYFNVNKYILIWNIKKKKFSVIKGKDNFHLVFLVNGKIYAREWGKGIEEVKDNSLKLLKGSEKFANERIYIMLPFPGEKGTSLLVTRNMGLFKYDGNSFSPFKTQADNFIKANLVYTPGAVLMDGNILIGTVSGGAVVIDTTGKIVQIFNRQCGIISNSIDFTFQDNAGAVWLGTDNGISRVDYTSPVSYFDGRSNFLTTPNDIIRYKGTIYAGGNNGIYYLEPGTSLFHLVKNGSNQFFSLLNIGSELITGGINGLFRIENNELFPIRKTVGNEYNIQSLKQSKLNPDRIYVGAQGLWSVLKTKNSWKDEGRILNIADVVSSIIEEKDGTLWLATNASGVFKIIFKKDEHGNLLINKPKIEHFGKSNGLQSGYMKISNFNGVKYFVTSDSIYKFDDTKERFYSDTSDKIISSFYKLEGKHGVTTFQQDSLGRYWFLSQNTIAMGNRRLDGSFNWLTAPFKRFAGDQLTEVYSEKNGDVWMLAGLGLIKYDFSREHSKFAHYDALIRSVDVGRDSTIYFGETLIHPLIPEISFKDNSVKFKFSAASYEGKGVNRFETFLQGFDDEWSTWSTDNAKEYTNLSPGKYTFRVRAKNISDLDSREAYFSFVILPPWYRTWWSYLGYFLIFIGMIFTIDKVQRRRLTIKERQRSYLRETELRAEAAEAETKALQAENERNKNIELLSEIGKEITATLDLDKIFYKLYEHVNQLADATIFGVGIYHPEKDEIEYRLALEKGKKYPTYTRDTKNVDQFPVWCIKNRKPIFINDVRAEYKNYIKNYKEPETMLEDGTLSEEPRSLIYLPLISQERLWGIITIQSFSKNAYQDYHLGLLQNLASYTAIALDNAEAYKKLNETVDKLNSTLNDLKATQEKLVVQEKLASLGQLTAGIAHEIKNPLNFVNNFAELSKELVADLREEFDNVKDKLGSGIMENFEDIISNIEQNVTKINEHGNRADSIVRSMLQHSRGKSGEKILSDINAILDEDLNLAYHGLRARDTSFNITMEKDYDKNLEKISVVPQDLSRVFLNIINNGFYEANKKKKTLGDQFTPKLKVSTSDDENNIIVKIRDNGNGIPEDVRDKLFNPFFTTKPTGEGTGLGLSLSYDIVTKVHGGKIKFDSEEGKFTEFIITIPKSI